MSKNTNTQLCLQNTVQEPSPGFSKKKIKAGHGDLVAKAVSSVEPSKAEVEKHTFARLSRLSDLSLNLANGIETTELLRRMAESIRSAMKADEAFFMLLDFENFELVLAACSGKRRKRSKRIKCHDRRTGMNTATEYGFPPSPRSAEQSLELDPESSMLRDAFASRQRLLFTRQMKDKLFEGVPYQSAMVLPLVTSTQEVGLLVVANIVRSEPFSANDMEEAGIFANLAAMAVEHEKLLRERESRLLEMEKLNLLAKRFSTVQTLEGLIGLSFEYLNRIIPHELGVVALFNEDEEIRYFVSERSLSPAGLQNLTAHLQEISANLRGKTSKNIRCQQIFLPRGDMAPIPRTFRTRIQSFLTVPLTVAGQNIGLINLSAARVNAFTREHLRAFTTLSNLLATAIENVKIRLYLERRIEEISVLFEISQSITSTLVLDEVLDSIVNFSMEMMHALRCELRLVDATGRFLEVRAARGLSKTFLASTPIKVGEGLLGTVVATKRPITVVDIRKDPRTKHLKMTKRERLAGLLAVPILQRNNAIGVITVYTSKPRSFTQNEIDLLSTFASQASIAIENARLYAKMKDQYLSMVAALAAAIETKDAYTHGHSKNVMEYAVKIAQRFNLSAEEIETIRYAGLLHDIGKIGIKDVILSKQSALTAQERFELRKHPKYGAFIMEQVDFLKEIAPLTLYHHERYDGTGYPLGLKGEDIPLGARILAVADTYDSMIADRPYRKALPYDKVLRELKKVAGTQLDPKVVAVFLDILKDEHQIKSE